MKQPLAGVVALFAAGILLGRWATPSLMLLFVVALATGCLALRPRPTTPGWFALFVIIAGWTNLAWRTALLAPHDLRHVVTPTEQLATLRGTLREAPSEHWRRRGEEWRTNTLAVLACDALQPASGAWRPAQGLVVVSTPGPLPEPFRRGCPVTISGVLRMPSGPAAPGLFDYAAHLASRGIHFELRTGGAEDWEVTADLAPPPRSWTEAFQDWARRILTRGLREDEREVHLLRAMLLGWKTGLTDEVEEPFVRSGTLHLFAISGLHIALIAEILVQVLRLFRVPRLAAGVVVIPVLWFYTLATGSQPSAVRATLMTSVVVGGWMLARPVDLLNSLAVAALVVLIAEPHQLFQAGFQLSFAVVAAIGTLVPPLAERFQRIGAPDPFLPDDLVPHWRRIVHRVGRGIGGSIAVSAACWAGALPLTAWYFHLVTPVSLLANLVVVPLGTAALASSLASLVCGDWLPGAGVLFNHGAWFWMHAARTLSEWFADIPGGSWYVRRPPLAGVALWYVVLAALRWRGWRTPKARRGWGAVILVLLAATGVSWRRDRPDVRAVVLPLRGGHAVYVEHPLGPTLVDTGDAIAAEGLVRLVLQAQGVNTLASLVLTHGDVRHVGGARELLERHPARRVVVSPVRFRSTAYREVVDAIRERIGERLASAANGDATSGWRVLHPAAGDTASQADDAALVLALPSPHADRASLLLVSDLGRTGQELLRERHPGLRAEVVVTGLPAPGEPIPAELLEQWQTRVVIVADALHPAGARAPRAWKDTVRRMTLPRVVFTSETGALELRSDRGRWTIRDAAGQVLVETSVLDEAGIVAGDEVQDGHADRESVGHLLEDDGTLAIRGVGIDLHPAIDRARVHDQDIGLQPGHAGAVEAELGPVFTDAGEHAVALPLVLDAKEIHHVGVTKGLPHIPADAAAEPLKDARDQRGRSAEGDLGAQLVEGPDVGAGHPAEQDVANDGDLEPLETFPLLPDGEDIEQGLRRVFMRAIPRIDHAGLEKPGEEMRGPGRRMSDDNDVRIHRLEVPRGVTQRFALLQGGHVGAEIDHVRGQPLLGEFETDPRAGGRLDKEVDHRLAAKRRHGLDGTGADRLEAAGGVEDGEQFLAGQRFDVEEMSAVPGHVVTR